MDLVNCPACGSSDTAVKDSRPNSEISSIRRRRFCVSCRTRFTTYELIFLDAAPGSAFDTSPRLDQILHLHANGVSVEGRRTEARLERAQRMADIALRELSDAKEALDEPT